MLLYTTTRRIRVGELSAHCLFMYDPRERLTTGKPVRVCAGGRGPGRRVTLQVEVGPTVEQLGYGGGGGG